MSMCTTLLRNSINLADRCFGLRKLMREEKATAHPLAGDRAIEWSWVTIHLPAKQARVLDLGCVESVLTGIASRLGHNVTAVDLRDIEYEMPRVTFRKGNINDLDFCAGSFDVIMNCSMIEHVGLENRYDSVKMTDGDLVLMKKLSKLLSPGGKMILTIPIGVDATFSPFHRIYGTERLPQLLEDFRLLEEEYWGKGSIGLWKKCNKEIALSTKGSADYYALGLFLLGNK